MAEQIPAASSDMPPRRGPTVVVALLVATILAAVAAGIAWRSTTALYTCVAVIHVKPIIDPVMYEVGGKGRLLLYDSFCDMQMQLLKTRRVIDAAMHSEKWQNMGRGMSDAAVKDFIDRLQVVRQGELIQVSMTDPEPAAATAGVQAVVRAWNDLYVEEDVGSREEKLEALRRLETQRQFDYNSLQQRIRQAAAKDGGPENFEWTYQTAQAEWRRHRQTLDDLKKQRLALLSAPAEANADADADLAVKLLDEKIEGTEKSIAEQSKRLEALDDFRSRIATLREETDFAWQRRNEVHAKIDQLDVEWRDQRRKDGRIVILSYGDMPLEPSNFQTRRDRALAAAAVTWMLGLALIITIAGRPRHPSQSPV